MSTELRTNVINWSDPQQQITQHVTVAECLTLHAWGRLATSADGADFQKLTILCNKLEEIRALLDCPINIHCMFRSKEYNKSQGINPELDAHALNEAVDFDCNGHYTIEEVKELLIPELEKLGIRLEKGTTAWLHVDNRTPGPSGRYFTP